MTKGEINLLYFEVEKLLNGMYLPVIILHYLLLLLFYYLTSSIVEKPMYYYLTDNINDKHFSCRNVSLSYREIAWKKHFFI